MHTAYHEPALVLRHPRCPPPVFRAMTPSQIATLRKVEAQEDILRRVGEVSPLAVQLIERVLHAAEEFSPAEVRAWFARGGVDFGDEPEAS